MRTQRRKLGDVPRPTRQLRPSGLRWHGHRSQDVTTIEVWAGLRRLQPLSWSRSRFCS